MAFRPLLRQRAVAPAVAAMAGTSLFFMAPRQLHAEERPTDELNRKPIYDSEPPTSSAPSPTSGAAPTSPSSPAEPYRPTPTDRLAVQIGYARLWAYKQATKAEDGVNNALTETLKLEHSFTSTIRGLAPSRESGEKILPGGLYVLVATMAGSIITRNRNILLRASVPVAIGIGTAYAVIPVTMENVGKLIWKYEEKYPVLADTHLRARTRVQSFWETGKAHTAMSAGMLQDKVGETREKLEDWVKKGR